MSKEILRQNQRGDTLVEVLLATVIIAVVLSGAYALTNRATRLNQSAIERTTVSNIMSEQIEQIRGIRTSGYGMAAWKEIETNKVRTTQPRFSTTDCSPTPGSQPFYVSRNKSLNDYNNAAMIVTYTTGNDMDPNDLFDVWIEAYYPAATSDYIDFHVRACWEGIGEAPLLRSGLVLRITR